MIFVHFAFVFHWQPVDTLTHVEWDNKSHLSTLYSLHSSANLQIMLRPRGQRSSLALAAEGDDVDAANNEKTMKF